MTTKKKMQEMLKKIIIAVYGDIEYLICNCKEHKEVRTKLKNILEEQ